MGFSGRERYLLLGAALCLGALAVDRFALAPLAAIWTGREAAIQDLEQSLEKGALLAGRHEVMSGRWLEMRARSLPPSESRAENEVLRAVSRWAQESRLEITSIKPRWRRESETYSTLDIRTTGQGSLDAIVHFLYRLESGALPLRVESFESAARDDSGSLLTFDLAFSGLQLAEGDS